MRKQFIYDIDYSLIGDKDKIVIYGAGKFGRDIARKIKEKKTGNVAAFIDKNATNKQAFDKIPIYEADKIELFSDYKIIVAISDLKAAEEVKIFLKSCGISADRIISLEKQYIWDEDNIGEVLKFTKRFFSKYRKKFFVFMLPEHGNTGDYLIGYAEKKFFAKYFPNNTLIGITTIEWMKLKYFIKNLVQPQDVIFLNGGGYFGDLRGDDKVYKDIIESFPENCKIFLPNTLTYREMPSEDNKQFIKDVQWLNSQKDIHVFLRDKLSYQNLNKFFCNSYYFPDMALFWKKNYSKNAVYKNKVLLCLRNDCETTNYELHKKIKEKLNDNKIEYDCFDIFINEYIDQEDGENLVQYVFDKFVNYKCIITNRLHAMLISTIASVPCLAFDNSTKKICGVFEWIKKYKYVKIIDENCLDKIGDYINQICLNENKSNYIPDYNEFDRMAKKIQNLIC